MSSMATGWPLAAKSLLTPRPMPEAPPVTTTTRLLLRLIRSFLSRLDRQLGQFRVHGVQGFVGEHFRREFLHHAQRHTLAHADARVGADAREVLVEHRRRRWIGQ